MIAGTNRYNHFFYYELNCTSLANVNFIDNSSSEKVDICIKNAQLEIKTQMTV